VSRGASWSRLMATNDHSGRNPTNSVRLKGFDRKEPGPAEPPKAPTVPAADPPAGGARLNFPTPSTTPNPTPSQNATPAPVTTPSKDEAPASPPAQQKPSSAANVPAGSPRIAGTFRTESAASAASQTLRPASGSLPDRSGNAGYMPDPDPERVQRRQWWKYDLFMRSGRKLADEEAGSMSARQAHSQ